MLIVFLLVAQCIQDLWRVGTGHVPNTLCMYGGCLYICSKGVLFVILGLTVLFASYRRRNTGHDVVGDRGQL